MSVIVKSRRRSLLVTGAIAWLGAMNSHGAEADPGDGDLDALPDKRVLATFQELSRFHASPSAF